MNHCFFPSGSPMANTIFWFCLTHTHTHTHRQKKNLDQFFDMNSCCFIKLQSLTISTFPSPRSCFDFFFLVWLVFFFFGFEKRNAQSFSVVHNKTTVKIKCKKKQFLPSPMRMSLHCSSMSKHSRKHPSGLFLANT